MNTRKPTKPRSMTHQYLTVISRGGPLIIVRVPWPMPPWRKAVMSAMTRVMHSYGLKKKDIHFLDGQLDMSKADDENRHNLEAAFNGDEDRYAKFDLYDLKGTEFVLVRKGRQ